MLYVAQSSVDQCTPYFTLTRAAQNSLLQCLMPIPDAGRLRDFDRGPPDFADDDFDPDGTVNDSLPGYRRLMATE